MPKNKHQKQRIRARMAKTGESYSAARLHVVGQSAGAPLVDPSWHEHVGKFVVMPGMLPRELPWPAKGKGPHRTRPMILTGSIDRRRGDLERVEDDTAAQVIQAALASRGIATVEEAWRFLQDDPSDDPVLRAAKANWRSKGVVETYRLVGAPGGRPDPDGGNKHIPYPCDSMRIVCVRSRRHRNRSPDRPRRSRRSGGR